MRRKARIVGALVAMLLLPRGAVASVTYDIVSPLGFAGGFISINRTLGESWGLDDLIAFRFEQHNHAVTISSDTPGVQLFLSLGTTELTETGPLGSSPEIPPANLFAWDSAIDIALGITRGLPDIMTIAWNFSDALFPSDAKDATAADTTIVYRLRRSPTVPEPSTLHVMGLLLAGLLLGKPRKIA